MIQNKIERLRALLAVADKYGNEVAAPLAALQALPALLDVAEAARELLVEFSPDHLDWVHNGHRGSDLRAALAALQGGRING